MLEGGLFRRFPQCPLKGMLSKQMRSGENGEARQGVLGIGDEARVHQEQAQGKKNPDLCLPWEARGKHGREWTHSSVPGKELRG